MKINPNCYLGEISLLTDPEIQRKRNTENQYNNHIFAVILWSCDGLIVSALLSRPCFAGSRPRRGHLMVSLSTASYIKVCR